MVFKTLIEFEKEYEFANKSQLPTTVCVYGKLVDKSGCSYMVMEYCKNGSLDHFLKNETLTWCAFFKISISILHCINDLHNCNPIFLHGDLKPANFLVDDNGEIKITDFSLSKINTDKNSTKESLRKLRGTHNYIAPEVYDSNGIYSSSSDMFSISIVIFEIIFKLISNKPCILCRTNSSNRPNFPTNTPTLIKNFISKMWSVEETECQSSSEAIKEFISIEKEYQTNKDHWYNLLPSVYNYKTI